MMEWPKSLGEGFESINGDGAGRPERGPGREELAQGAIRLGTFALGSLLSGLAPSPWSLVAARALQGLGAATLCARSSEA